MRSYRVRKCQTPLHPGPCAGPGGDEPSSSKPSGSKPQEAPQPSAKVRIDTSLSPKAQQHMGEVVKALKAASHLSPQHKVAYFNTAQDTLKRMSPKAQERLVANTKEYAFHEDVPALTAAVVADYPQLQDAYKPGSGKSIGGGYQKGKQRLVLDGSGEEYGKNAAIGQLYSHEMSHAIDGPKYEISGSPEWEAAFKSELASEQLCKYAASSPHEGFAEFGRLVINGDMDKAEIEKRFPKCAAVWKQWGLM